MVESIISLISHHIIIPLVSSLLWLSILQYTMRLLTYCCWCVSFMLLSVPHWRWCCSYCNCNCLCFRSYLSLRLIAQFLHMLTLNFAHLRTTVQHSIPRNKLIQFFSVLMQQLICMLMLSVCDAGLCWCTYSVCLSILHTIHAAKSAIKLGISGPYNIYTITSGFYLNLNIHLLSLKIKWKWFSSFLK